jgi:ubiquinone/menaquinone biosynthesis C-methylase UbiE
MLKNVHLLPKDLLITTNSVDHADWNYKPLLRWIQRMRFRMVTTFLNTGPYDKVLEMGYGSGIFMPELSMRCTDLYGIDIHPYASQVSKILKDTGIDATLSKGSVDKMDYPDKSFDLVVSVSTFEFIDNKQAACEEIKRVLKKDGHFVLVTPSESWLLDFGFKILTKENARKDFGDNRKAVVPLLNEHFKVSRSLIFPSFMGRIFPVYTCYDLMLKS